MNDVINVNTEIEPLGFVSYVTDIDLDTVTVFENMCINFICDFPKLSISLAKQQEVEEPYATENISIILSDLWSSCASAVIDFFNTCVDKSKEPLKFEPYEYTWQYFCLIITKLYFDYVQEEII